MMRQNNRGPRVILGLEAPGWPFSLFFMPAIDTPLGLAIFLISVFGTARSTYGP